MRIIDDELDAPAQINIVPMIDVIFSILAFFIVSSLHLSRVDRLPVNLPTAAPNSPPPIQSAQLIVTIAPSGQIVFNDRPLELEQLDAEVRQLVKPNAETVIVLNADAAVFHGRVVQVMDRLSQISGVKLAIGTGGS
jgi:biopolymer transport protein ExbD